MGIGWTGFSTPFGGVSWEKCVTSKDRFSFLLLYLESKRVLFNPWYDEEKMQCVESVSDIKKTLVEITKDVKFNKEDLALIKNLINACNKFLDNVNVKTSKEFIYTSGYERRELFFCKAMGDFRKSFKESIKAIENKYGLKFNVAIPDTY